MTEIMLVYPCLRMLPTAAALLVVPFLALPAVSAECDDVETQPSTRIEACTEALGKIDNPGQRVDLLVQRASQYRLLGQLEEAEVDLAEALRSEPDHVGALLERGRLLRSLGKSEPAVEAFSRVLELDARNWRALLNRMDILADLGLYEECLDDATRAVELAPEQPHTWAYRGRCLFELRRNDEAIADYERAAEIGLEFAFLHDNLAMAYLRAGRNEEALAAARHAAELDPTHEGAHYDVVEALVKLGRMEEAIAAYHKGKSQRTSDEFKHANNLAWLLYLAGEYEQALAIIEDEFFDHNPELTAEQVYEADTYAHILAAVGQKEKAVEMFLRAAELGGREKVASYQERLNELGIEPGVGEEGFRRALEACAERGGACQLDD